VVVVQEETTSTEADAVITREAGLALSILTADCLPLLLAAEDGSEIAAVHCGWRGLAAGIIDNTITAMQTPPASILAWMGPAIGPCHFEVGRDVHAALSAILADDALASAFTPAVGEKFMADLYKVATALLRRQGVQRISGGGLCTSCDQRRFFSYRVSPVCGRNATTICIRSA
jgi:YfiH family protein